jgi:hypothetical protein
MSLEQEVKRANNLITVVFRDNKRKAEFDLDLFPSETLRAIKRSKFADRNEVELPFYSTDVMRIYEEYTPIDVRDYLQVQEHAIKLADFALVVDASWWEPSSMWADVKAYGKIKFSRGRQSITCNITIDKVQISGKDDAERSAFSISVAFDMDYVEHDDHAHGELKIDYELDKEFMDEFSNESDVSKGLKNLIEEDFREKSEQSSQSIKLREWIRFHMIK